MLLVLRRNSGCKTISRTVRQPVREDLVPAALARRHNLRQRGDCSVRPKPQHSLLNLGLVVALALLDPLAPPQEQGLVRLVSNSSSNNHSSSSLNSSQQEQGLVRLVKPSHSNQLASVLVVLAPRNSSNSNSRSSSKRVVFSAPLLSVKRPQLVDSVRMSRSTLLFPLTSPRHYNHRRWHLWHRYRCRGLWLDTASDHHRLRYHTTTTPDRRVWHWGIWYW